MRTTTTDPKNNAVLQHLLDSPMAKAAAREMHIAQQEERQALIQKIEAIKHEEAMQRQQIIDEVETTRQGIDIARMALDEATVAHNQALAQRSHASFGHTARITKAEHQLRTTASPAIDKFVSWTREQQSKLMNKPIREQARKTGMLNSASYKAEREYWSSAPSTGERMAALRDACLAAEALKLRVLEPDELQQRLDALKDNLPVEGYRMQGVA